MGVCVLSWCYENSDVENTDLRHSQNSLFSNYNPPKYRLAKGCHWINFLQFSWFSEDAIEFRISAIFCLAPFRVPNIRKNWMARRSLKFLPTRKNERFLLAVSAFAAFLLSSSVFSFGRARASAYLTSQLDFMRFVARCVYKQFLFKLMFFLK